MPLIKSKSKQAFKKKYFNVDERSRQVTSRPVTSTSISHRVCYSKTR